MTFTVYRDGVLLASGLTSTTFTDQTVTPFTSYSYTVTQVNQSGDESLPSAPLAVQTPDVAPAVPSNLHAVIISPLQVVLAWD